MTKDRILLLDSYISFYTLGALTDDSDDVLVLNQTLYDGTFPLKDLVSKSFDVKSFEKSVSFNIYNTRKLSKLIKPAMPYKLQVGSSVRYKNKTYQVIGYYYNQFAQLNIISPILFNPSNVVTDVANLFYGLKSNKEVIDIINDNFMAGKYSNDIVFPLTVGVKSYKKELSNIQAPPFTSLDSLTIKKKEEIKVGEPLIPYKLDLNQIDIQGMKDKMAKDDFVQDEIKFFTDIESFADISEKRPTQDKKYNELFDYGNYFTTKYSSVGEGVLPLLPYNLIPTSKIENIRNEYVYKTPVGDIYPILRVGVCRNYGGFKYLSENYFFGISLGRGGVDSNKVLDNLLFKNSGGKATFKGNESSNDFINKNESQFASRNEKSIDKTESSYVLKENTYYGGFFASSGSIDQNSSNDETILPFGAVFKKSGIYYYLLGYFDSESEKNAYCLCIKTSTRTNTITPSFQNYTKTEMKASYKKFTKEEVYKAFKKEGHIFDIDDSYYSLPQSINSKSNEPNNEPNPTLVTDVFLEKRADQFEVLQNNFPELSNTFLGILSVLDKSLSKPKISDMVREKGLVYLVLNDRETKFRLNSKEYYDEAKNDKLVEISKQVGERKANATKEALVGNGRENISDKIFDLAVDTCKIKLKERPQANLYIALKSFEDFQKYAVSRIAINIFDNYELFQLNDNKTFRGDFISFPPHNTFQSLSSDTFLGVLPEMFLSGIREKNDELCFYRGNSYYSDSLRIRLFKSPKEMEDNIFLYAQMIFVLETLGVLYKNAINVYSAKASNSYDEFLENANFIRQIKTFDLSLPIDALQKHLIYFRFTRGRQGISLYEQLSEQDRQEKQVFEYNAEFVIDSEGQGLDLLKTLIKQIDKLYNGIFQLEEKIINNKSKKLFVNFPKVETREEEIEEEEMFDDTDLFEDAFEELGDEFLQNIEELDIDELI